jgi:CRISPR-associated endonuclease cas1, NMENI subtype
MYRHVIIEQNAYVYYKNRQLYVKGDEEYHIPIEDIATVLLASSQITVTARALDALVESGANLVVCNSSFMPSGTLVPFGSNSRRLKMIRLQVNQSKPRLKRLWQQIIKQKIRNQGLCLQYMGVDDCLSHLVDKVTSGDTEHVEGYAAGLYFKALFGDDFVRHDDTVINGVLNYGYAILRSSIARFLAVYGFEPALGIFHHSELNAFNLADDLIEPFRPVVDLWAASACREASEFSVPMRRDLVRLLSCHIMSGEEKHVMNYAIERTVQSLSACYADKQKELLLPSLLPIERHVYE